jgi:branched-chain amino acid transport system permease protein
MKKRDNKNLIKQAIIITVLLVALLLINLFMDSYQIRIVNLALIYIVLGLSMNLINGFTGLFSLGHAGFMAIGAYTTALLTIPPELKEVNFYMKPIVPFLADLDMPFVFALLMGGVMAALFGFLIGAPVLKLTDDYLAIATLGFSEIIRVVIINLQSVTNGALGLKGIPQIRNLFIADFFNVKPQINLLWAGVSAIITVYLMKRLMEGSYGKALKAIR